MATTRPMPVSCDRIRRAQLLAKERGVVAGVDLAKRIFHSVDIGLKVEILIEDGEQIGLAMWCSLYPVHPIRYSRPERLVLNFMQRMSGIATQTNRLVRMLEGTHAKLLDTRKTTPLLRELKSMP
jgi:nicotinate-nucleotide pyrophosphorylase (carboxylating)